MDIRLQEAVFDPWQELARYQKQQSAILGQYGATGVFVGTMRNSNAGDTVTALTLEHYPGMTERQLNKVCLEAHERWQLLDSLLIHRYGRIVPGETIVLVATWSGHRQHALEACRYIIDELKTRAPFWKQEAVAEGLRWLQPESE